jgi:hypothetical protein
MPCAEANVAPDTYPIRFQVYHWDAELSISLIPGGERKYCCHVPCTALYSFPSVVSGDYSRGFGFRWVALLELNTCIIFLSSVSETI